MPFDDFIPPITGTAQVHAARQPHSHECPNTTLISHMEFLPDDIPTTNCIADPTMLLVGVHVGYRARDATASPAKAAFCLAAVRAMLLASLAGGYTQPEFGHSLFELMNSPDPLQTAQAICHCTTPAARSFTLQRPDFESICKIL